MPLLSLSSPRGDAPAVLPAPAQSGVGGCSPIVYSAGAMPEELITPLPVARPVASVDTGNVPGIMHSALRADLALSPPEQRNSIIARFSAIRTRADADRYLSEVRQKMRAARPVSPTPR